MSMAKRMKLKHERFPMVRRHFNQSGRPIGLLTNHFQLTVAPPTDADGYFYAYIVAMKRADGILVGGEVLRRKVLDRVGEIYEIELQGKQYAYDGGRSLFSIAPLFDHSIPQLNVIVDDVMESPFTYNVSITYDKKIPMKVIDRGDGEPAEQFRVLDAILRHGAANEGGFFKGRAVFPCEAVNLNGGVASYKGFRSSFRTTQGGLTLNIDASTALIMNAGPLKQFLLLQQGVTCAAEIDWFKANTALKNLRIVTTHSNMEYKISGLSHLRCSEQTFLFKRKTGSGETEEVDITVYDYFVCHRNIQLHESGDFPCIDVGKDNHPIYIPIELCCLVPLQRYREPLSDQQRSRLLNSRPFRGPQQTIYDLKQALIRSNYGASSLLKSCGVSISRELKRIVGRVLAPPKLMIGPKNCIIPHSGKWSFARSKLVHARNLERWAAVNFSTPCDMRKLCQDLIRCGEMIGYSISDPVQMFEEKPENASMPARTRVDQMIEKVLAELLEVPKFLLCILPERKNCHLYGPWKRKTLCEVGIISQCVAATCVSEGAPKGYIRNVLLKMNAKLIGLNWALRCEFPTLMPHLRVLEVPTLIVGASVCHFPGKPSVAAAVSSMGWPCISRYLAKTRSQPPNSKLIEALFDKVSDTKDEGMFGELLNFFRQTSTKRLPDRIIIFRDGVSESQFEQVLNVELKQIIEACKFVSESWSPKFMVVVAQKRHDTRFFRSKFPSKNVPSGTVVDTKVCHPRNNDFYLCSHAATTGTARPTRYHVLCDEIGCSAAEIQEFVHALSFVYQPSNSATSVVAPILYAHRAAAQMARVIETDDSTAQVPPLPKLHGSIFGYMYFC